jgi:hypothetical protein
MPLCARLGLQYVQIFLDMPFFQASELCPGGSFNFTTESGFLAFVDSHIQCFGGCHVSYSS